MASDSILDLDIDPRSGYGTADLIRMFLAISCRPMGRMALLKELGLGEATIKTMSKFLRSRNLAEQGTRGIYPTKRGKRAFSCCSSLSKSIPVRIPWLSRASVALIVRRAASNVCSGIEQRDEGAPTCTATS